MSDTITVDIWSDIQCPWCYIGKRRFENALESFAQTRPEVEVKVQFHSFELSPDTPVDFVGSPVDYLMERKGMERQSVMEMMDQVSALAAEEGLDYHLDTAKQVNTRKAHELLHFAKKVGQQESLKEALLYAYFTQNRDLGNVEELVAIAADNGLDAEAVRASLTMGEYAQAVLADEAEAQQLGINGVPYYVINRRYGISGAQTADVFEQALTQVAGE